MKAILRATAAQIDVKSLDPTTNLARHWSAVEEIVDHGQVDLVVFPELASSGYVRRLGDEDDIAFFRGYLGTAQDIPGPFTDSLSELAAKSGVHLVTGILESDARIPGVLYNTAVLIEPARGILGIARKLHIVADEKRYFAQGSDIKVFDTEVGRIGVMVCADNVFPEVARVMALKGAEIVCVPYSRVRGLGGRDDLYYSLISCRAWENNCFFVASNRIGEEGGVLFEGKSCICGPTGEFLARADGEGEEMLTADLVSDHLLMARMKYARFRDRRPELYLDLCEPCDR